jgi:hypothetical protein
MTVVRTAERYFVIVHEFRRAVEWQQKLMIRGQMALACRDLEPESLRLRLRVFWDQEAARLGIDTAKWKSWP